MCTNAKSDEMFRDSIVQENGQVEAGLCDIINIKGHIHIWSLGMYVVYVKDEKVAQVSGRIDMCDGCVT